MAASRTLTETRVIPCAGRELMYSAIASKYGKDPREEYATEQVTQRLTSYEAPAPTIKSCSPFKSGSLSVCQYSATWTDSNTVQGSRV